MFHFHGNGGLFDCPQNRIGCIAKKEYKVGRGGAGHGHGYYWDEGGVLQHLCPSGKLMELFFFTLERSCYALAWSIYYLSSIRCTLNGHFVLYLFQVKYFWREPEYAEYIRKQGGGKFALQTKCEWFERSKLGGESGQLMAPNNDGVILKFMNYPSH